MALYTPEYQPTGEEIAVINTSKGPIRVQLAGNDAPIHVGNFVELAQKGFYDGLKFHRYVPGFVIQGGCPNTREATPEQVAAGRAPGLAPFGTGNPGYSIKEEFTTNPNNSHEDGALAMARSMDPNSAGSQFYLCLGPQHNLDSGYTVFGQTIEGKDYLLMKPVTAEWCIIKGYKVDKLGNVWYKGSAQNFNRVMATAADIVIVEAEELVEVGEIEPENVMTPGILVDYIVIREGK